ncbi:O-antigen ligase domain-containing protein [Methylolobus aquaticus]|nr:O-antigen ligase domain-containing protein [Methylolobus aquaticus]
MSSFLALNLLSLLIGLKLKVGVITLRPFDAITAIGFLFAFALACVRRHILLPIGILTLLPFFFVHVVSAFSIDMTNGLREAVQVLIVSCFALTLAISLDRFVLSVFSRTLFLGMWVLTLYNIWWHISNGFFIGWKRLNDPKHTFILLPIILSVVMLTPPDKRNWLRGRHSAWLVWLGFGVLVFLSGERKALISFFILSVLLLTRGRIKPVLVGSVIGGGVVASALALAPPDSGYLGKQLHSIFSPLAESRPDPYQLSIWEANPEYHSNAQRLFAFEQGKSFFLKSPLFGVGTNGYQSDLKSRFHYLPEFLSLGIHNEFFRIMVENGIVGLVTYAFVWVTSVLRALKQMSLLNRHHLLDRRSSLLMLAVFYLPLALFLGVEASGSRSLVTLTLIALAPDILSTLRKGGAHPGSSLMRTEAAAL